MASVEPSAGNVILNLETEEAQLLRGLLDEMRQLLEHEATIDDAVIDRLFPSAYAEPDDARAFAELVGDELKTGKLDNIRSVLSVLGEPGAVNATVPRSEIDGWLTVLTDVRLALGTRFDVTEEKMSAELDPDDPEAPGLAILHWLGWMQEMFIAAITEGNDDGPVAAG